MKVYDTIKYSGIDYLGEIPEHWQLWKFKTITSILTCGYASTPEYVSEENGVPFLSAQNVKPGKIVLDKYNFISKKLHSELTKNKKPKKGDVLVARVGGEGNIGDAALVNLDFDFSVYVSLTHIRPRKNLYNKFLIYFFQSGYSRLLAKIETQVGGGVGNLNVKDMERYKLPIPPLPEQRQIAAYLDYKTNQIDRFIANRKKQIELLEEQKEAIINKAVTKGIDPTVKLKPSGVDWIGDIPEHWEVWKVRYLSKKVLTGTTPPSNELKYYDSGTINWFAPGDFGDDFELNDSTRKITALAIQDNVCKLYKKDSVLVIGIGATLGKVRFCKSPCSSNQQINSIEFNKKVIQPKYGFYFLHSFEDVIISRSNASTMGILNQSKTKEIEIAFPRSIDDQNEIIEHIENELQERNELISKYQKQIELIQEYKTSLISKAVTGKIDVREWHPKQTINETV